MNLTEKLVSKVAPGARRVHLYDDQVTGFGVRVEPNGRKSFFWYAKVNGVPRYRALGEFPSITVAQARDDARSWVGKAAEWKRSGCAGEDPFEKRRPQRTEVPTFEELVEAYIQNHVKENANRPDRAEYQVRWMLKRHFHGWLDHRVDKITIEDLLSVKNRCGKRRVLANRAVEFIRALFNWSAGSRDGKVNFWKIENPAIGIETYDEKARDRFLQPNELVRFNDELKKEPHVDLRDFLTLAINTGARRSDLFGMRWEDIQWERQIWCVPFPKNGEAYDVQLLPAAMQVLKRRRMVVPSSSKWVFPGTGQTGHLVDLKKQWNEFRKRAGILDIRLHDVRRTHGSYLAIAGVSLQQIGAALGHKSHQSTLVYAKLHTEAVRAARETGQAKMRELMKAAKRRAKLESAETKLLSEG